MALLQISGSTERSAMKQLFNYIHLRTLRGSNSFEYHFDSTWEQAYNFLLHFDPKGSRHGGYTATKLPEEILRQIDQSPSDSLPILEVFLDLSLSLSDHLYGLGTDDINGPMKLDPALEPILIDLKLLEPDGTPTLPLQVHAIDRWNFFGHEDRQLETEAQALVERVAEDAWQNAPTDKKGYILSNLADHSLEYWFADNWRLGVWLNKEEIERSIDLFGSHSAMSWLVVSVIKKRIESISR